MSLAAERGLLVSEDLVFEDEGFSGASLQRPALERLRDRAAQGAFEILLCHAPDRLARRYAYQVLLLEEFARVGVEVVFAKEPERGATPEDELLHFKALKYRPEFPERFADIEHARAHCRRFFHWYNHKHRRSGIGLMTPAALHHGRAKELHAARARVLEAAYACNPERFVRGRPFHPHCRPPAWINKPNTKEVAH